MRDYNLVLSPFETLDTLHCHLKKTVNEHVTLHYCGHILRENEDTYLKASLRDIAVKLSMVDEAGKEHIVFQGVAQDIQIQTEGDLRRLVVKAVSGSYYMDVYPYTRVFQDSTTTYDTVLKHLEKTYTQSGHTLTVGDRATIKDLLIQYHETDWQFAKRLASHFHSVLVPAYQKSGIHYSFGLPDGKQNISLSQNAYTIKKAADAYLQNLQNQTGNMTESDALCLEIQSRDIFEIGDSFTFQNQPYSIFCIESNLDGRELLHTYSLKPKAGLQTIKTYNQQMVGASLDATITGVTKDTVQVKLQADGIQSNPQWFPFSTVYSSPDGTGWYCMPEIGDAVRLYLPSEHEEEGYILSAVHVPQGDKSTARSNPNFKSLKSKYGKEVLFTPGSLVLTNNNGMSIEILDNEGIKITSDKAVTIQSQESIQIASTKQSVNVTAQDAIQFVQGDTSLTLQEDIHLSGAQVHME